MRMRMRPSAMLAAVALLLASVPATSGQGCVSQIMFVLDSSWESLGSTNEFDSMKSSVISFVTNTFANYPNTYIGFVSYATTILNQQIPLPSFEAQTIRAALQNAAAAPVTPGVPQERNLHTGLATATNLLLQNQQNGISGPLNVIVISFGLSSNQAQTRVDADSARNAGVNIYTVGVVGSFFNDNALLQSFSVEMQYLAGDAVRNNRVSSAADLSGTLLNIPNEICKIRIETMSSTLNVYTIQRAVLEVRLNQEGISTGRWLKNGQSFTDVTNERLAVYTDGAIKRLIIERVLESDAATYSFEIGTERVDITLTVTPGIVGLPSIPFGNLGGDLVIAFQLARPDCTRSNGIWQFEQTTLYSGGIRVTTDTRYNYDISQDCIQHSLRVTNVQVSDSGTYTFNYRGQVAIVAATIITETSPVDGGYSNWSPWTPAPCSESCGGTASRQTFRSRQCNNPFPRNGGQPCSGNSQEASTINCGLGNCPINGGVNVWAEWDTSVSCPATCGSLAQKIVQRTRTCTSPVTRFGGIFCTESLRETRAASCGLTNECPTVTDGGYSDWGVWIFGVCSGTCGSNLLRDVFRERLCNNPAPSPSGQPCDPSLARQSQIINCGLRDCPVNGGFSEWGPWNIDTAPCDFTCGVAATKEIRRTRTCTNPRPSNEGATCVGVYFLTSQTACSLPPCAGPVDGVYTAWGQWAVVQACTATCGDIPTVRVRNRTRTCIEPQNGGLPCFGSSFNVERTSCFLNACPRDGGFGSWGPWQTLTCPDQCGVRITRTVRRVRQCDNPTPLNGGAECDRNGFFEERLDSCFTDPCPVPIDGGFTDWSSWLDVQPCNATCGINSFRVLGRSRTCTNPIPSQGGRPCDGAESENINQNCGQRGCPVDGGPGQWGQWTQFVCSLTCGVASGVRSRSRPCDSPRPQFAGAECNPNDLEEDQNGFCTNLPQCPVPIDGGVSVWTEIVERECPGTCGRTLTRTILKTRECNNPFPSNGGRSCVDIGFPLTERETRNCGFNDCPVDGGIGVWSNWAIAACIATCGVNENRRINRTRECNNPPPAFGGNECPETLFESSLRNCELPRCAVPVDGRYTEWTPWAEVQCQATCGGLEVTSIRTRRRSCIQPENGGAPCDPTQTTFNFETVNCFDPPQPCPIDGGITQWSNWGTPFCPPGCGASTTVSVTRNRFCTAPVPQFNGLNCPESRSETKAETCFYNPCSVDGGISQWTQWSQFSCPGSCGITRTVSVFRQRFCTEPAPSFGGQDCPESRTQSESRQCVYNPCPVDGGISEWALWSIPDCPRSCGPFTTVTIFRQRFCNRPVPLNGGRDCPETRNQSASSNCNYAPCPIDGGISQWNQWTIIQCPLSCGPPKQEVVTRQRFCTNPPPSNGGLLCTESSQETRLDNCNYASCAVDGGISLWTAWTVPRCTLSCGTFTQVEITRRRFCDNPPATPGGRDCPESRLDTRTVNCNYTSCPIDGGFTLWSAWSTFGCGLTCGLTQIRTYRRDRTCTNPRPSLGGQNCLGPDSESYTENCRLPSCAVDGGISEWTLWQVPTCDRTCGIFTTVIARRSRICNNPSPSNGGALCQESTSQSLFRSCNYQPCPVDGRFTPWTQWNIPACALTCGTTLTRTWTRSRTCTAPIPQFGGAVCVGDSMDTMEENCNLPFCTVDGGISQWTPWVIPTCPFTCAPTSGSVVGIRRRYCNNPPNTDGGRNCTETRSQTQSYACAYQPCPVNGGYTAWTSWTIPPCTVTCGVEQFRIIRRERFCSSPTPANGGRPCTDPREQTRTLNCLLGPCPINGGVSEWTFWVRPPCPVTCGINIQRNITRYRFCDNPWPLYGGSECVGSQLSQTIAEPCQLPTCAVDGGFSSWSAWTAPTCIQTCGVASGSVSRVRTCTEPAPALGGRNCSGLFRDTSSRGCSLRPCPVSGGFAAWSSWVIPDCVRACGPNVFVSAYRSRSCTNPVAQNGGAICSGDRWETESRSCNLVPCPVDGGFTDWTPWTSPNCIQTCGIDLGNPVSRARSCTNPSPSAGGAPCVGDVTEGETRSCALPNCPVNGQWSVWAAWTNPTCAVTCGPTAIRVSTRFRTCSDPEPRFGGASCPGQNTATQIQNCGLPNCPVDGGLTTWTSWTDPPCPQTCGSTERKLIYRFRTCTNPQPQFNGRDCDTDRNQTRLVLCGNDDCPVDGGFTQWSPWTNPPCPYTCGSALVKEVRRSRACTNPAPRFGGQNCVGDTVDVKLIPCNIQPCPGTQGLCSSAQIINGVGYRYHPTDCDKYLQCYFNGNTYAIGVYRSCPFGYYWDQKTLRCDLPWKVDCPLEKCQSCVQNYNMEGSCRAHWVCEKNVSRGECCPMGFRYVLGQGCKPDFYCRDVCPTPCASRDVCDKRPDWDNDPVSYNISVGLLGWLGATCVPGTYFDLMECGCGVPTNASCTPDYSMNFDSDVTLRTALDSWLVSNDASFMSGYARFDGIGHVFLNISQKAPAVDCPLILRFRFTETRPLNGRRILASTKDCYNSNALVIAIDERDIVFEMTSIFGQLLRMPISLEGFRAFEWKTVTMMYDGNMVTAVVESAELRYMARQFAPEAKLMECGLRFGSDGSMSTKERFVGALDSISMYRCNPGNLFD